MKCPIDDTVLNLSERHGVEIDYCPTCRGVWLDRGELDKILELVGGADDYSRRGGGPPAGPSYDERRDRYDDDDRDRYDGDRYERDGDVYGGRRKRKRGGLLGELFEFGD